MLGTFDQKLEFNSVLCVLEQRGGRILCHFEGGRHWPRHTIIPTRLRVEVNICVHADSAAVVWDHEESRVGNADTCGCECPMDPRQVAETTL